MASENDNLHPKIASTSEVLVSSEFVLVSIAALVFPFLGVTLSSPLQSSAFPGIWAALSSPDLWHSVWLGRFFWASGIEIVLAVGVGWLFSKVASSASRALVLLLFVVSAISLLCSLAIPGVRSLEGDSVLRGLSVSLPIYVAAVLASLRLVPTPVYDAALVDGASTWLTFRRIMWPVLAPAMIAVVLSRLFVLLQEFARHYSLPATIPLACVLVILVGVFVWRALATGLLLTFRERTQETKPINTVKLLEESNANLVEAKVRSKEGIQIQMFGEAAWVTLPPELAQRLQEHPSEKITISFRPTNVHILSEPKKTAFHGVVYSFEPLGKMGLLTIEAVDGTRVCALVDGSSTFAIDRRVSFWVDPNDLVLQNWQLDSSTGQSEKTV
jgi:ABC-type spermidine/putrescine transport system permease subunit II